MYEQHLWKQSRGDSRSKNCKMYQLQEKNAGEKCVDVFGSYIDVRSKDNQVVTLQTDFQVLLSYFDMKG